MFQLLLWRLVSSGRLSPHDFFNKMGSMFAGHSQCFLSVIGLEIHFNSEFWFSGIDICGFSFAILSFASLDETFSLVDEYAIPSLRFVLTGNSKRRVEISNILIHADSFLSLACLDELYFSLLVSFFVLQFECEFEMDISNFMLGVEVGHLEGLVEFALV